NVYTTITKKTQQAANKAVIENLHNYDMRHGYRGATKVLWTKDETPWTAEKIEEALAQETTDVDLKPAVVVAVNEKSID
ncbi:hypothetical protein, partial [Pseudoalteromonas sp. Q36-MNA-CIBAN-0048]|uniref:hypothetical protein n=1 Tax=Pseudoalteromonas sp. Q36-MNA-CIBAN-0048 TaxID=3140479 RepID=UPI003323B4CF